MTSVPNNRGNPLRKILLLDDEPAVLFALRLLLQALGFEVADFPSGSAALDYLRADGKCDLFLCDLRMPKMDGIDVLREAKRINPQLPFVLMSAHATSEDIAAARTVGECEFLAKPFTPEDLHEVVGKIEEKRGS